MLQNWEDEDVKAALEEISKALADNIQLLSSWDKYRKEVRFHSCRHLGCETMSGAKAPC